MDNSDTIQPIGLPYENWLFLETFRENAKSQLDKGNKSAGLRARRASLDLEPLLKQFRKLSLEASNTK